MKRTHDLHLKQSIIFWAFPMVEFLRGPAGSLSGRTPQLLLSFAFARRTQRRRLTLLRMGRVVDLQSWFLSVSGQRSKPTIHRAT